MLGSKMEPTNKIGDLILEKWIASLASRDRTRDAVPTNFDELFSDLAKAGLTFDEAKALLPAAIKAHLPSMGLAKNLWKNRKSLHDTHADVNAFKADWDNSIKSCGTEAFFAHFPLKINDDEDNEPKVYGNMSAKEYRLQRKYAESFPILKTDDLVRQLRERRANKDVEINLPNVLGEDNDDK